MSVMTFTLPLSGPVQTAFTSPIPTQQCQVSDEGVSLVVKVVDSDAEPVNLRLLTSMKIITVRPSGISIETPAVFFTNGLDGRMAIVTSSVLPYGTGLDEFGTWLVQGRIVSSGNLQFTEIGAFYVGKNLGA